MRLLPVERCPLCQGPGRPLYQGLRDSLFGVEGEWAFSECLASACGLVWLNPAPIPEDLGMAYRSYYTHTPQRSAAFWKLMFGLYHGLCRFPAALFGLRKGQLQARDLYLGDLAPGKLLDLGCGDGQFLARMRARGWEVVGVDFDQAAVAAAWDLHRIRVLQGDLRSLRLPDSEFDAIVLNHVLEHVPSPVAELTECRRLLRPGGSLVSVTPNAHSLGHEWFGPAWRGLEPPRHLQIFAEPSLRACAEKAGFSHVRIFTTNANAAAIFSGSLGLQKKQPLLDRGVPTVRPGRALQAAWLQFKAHGLLTSSPLRGEEIVLIGT